MGLFKNILAPKWHGAQRKTVNLRTIIDPGDLMGGQAASEKLKQAEQANRLAMMSGISERERMFREAMAIGEPYRQMGYEALPKLQEGLQEGSPLDRMRSNLTKKFMAGYLQKQGFDPKVSGAVTGERLRKTMASEDVSRRGRAEDLMRLGAGQIAQGEGMVGAQGGRQARNIMAAGAMQADLLAREAQAKQNQMAALTYGGSRMAGDYIAKREADRYGGYY
jgi:hypothetical protein